jgi:transposase
MSTKTDARKLSIQQQEIIREKAVSAVLSGEKQASVARLFGVSAWSVCQWVKQARKKGVKSLKSKKRGTKTPQTKLNKRQEGVTRRMIEDKNPEQLKFPFVLWTREAVQTLIKEKYGISIDLRTVTDYLKRWGMTPQKPVAKAYQQSPEAIKQWLELDYPEIQKKAKREKAVIFWGDEMSLRSDHVAGRSFSPKGKKPVLIKTGNRFSCNMISAISSVGKLYFSIFRGSFVVDVYLEFLKRLVRQNKGRKVILIVDGHPVHKAKAVQAWLSTRVNELEVYYLPAYSPELNPDELLNQDLKSNVFKHKRPRNQKELSSMLDGKLRQIQRQPEKISNFFKGKYVTYSAV